MPLKTTWRTCSPWTSIGRPLAPPVNGGFGDVERAPVGGPTGSSEPLAEGEPDDVAAGQAEDLDVRRSGRTAGCRSAARRRRPLRRGARSRESVAGVGVGAARGGRRRGRAGGAGADGRRRVAVARRDGRRGPAADDRDAEDDREERPSERHAGRRSLGNVRS